MTLVFVCILAPFLLLSSHLVIFSHQLNKADEAKRSAKLAVEKAMGILGEKDWRGDLSTLFSSDDLAKLGIGAVVTDSGGHLLWRSQKNAPELDKLKTGSVIPIQRGDLLFYVSMPDSLKAQQPDLVGFFTLIGTAILVFCLAAWLLIGKTLSPIRALAVQAEAARADEAGSRLVSPSRDAEMRELVTTLNGFLDRIEEASEEKGRFYAAASHELRTPLQALLGHLEVSLSQARTAEEYEATIQEAHVQTQRLVSLVEGILLLHHLQGRAVTGRETVCLKAVVEETLETLLPLIETRDLQLKVRLNQDAKLSVVPSHVQILVRNLLENAAKYGKQGGHLTVTVEGTTLRIENEAADGIPVDRLFEPFYRQDVSRSTGGYGLGLAICRAIAKANDWRLTLRQEGNQVVAEVETATTQG